MFNELLNNSKSLLSNNAKRIIECFEQIDMNRIDQVRSKIEIIRNSFIHYYYYSTKDTSCPLYVGLGVNKNLNRVNFAFENGKDSIVAFNYDNLTENGFLEYMEKFVCDVLRSKIYTHQTILNSNVIKVTLECDKILDQHDQKRHTFGLYKKLIVLPWQKKENRYLTYEAWING